MTRWVGVVLLGVMMGGMLLVGLSGQGQASGEDEQRRSQRRQISIMAKVFDALLVESPNVLVTGKRSAFGLYLEGYGVILGAAVSLDLPEDWSLPHGLLEGIHIREDDDGKRIIVLPDDDEVFIERGEDSKADRHRRRWEGAREELFELLADYGPTIRGLSDGDKVGVALFRWDLLTGDEGPRTLLLEATCRDLRGFASGNISEEEFRSRIRVTEY